MSSLSYSAGFGTVSAGAPKELAAMARVRDYPGLVPGPDYNIGYDLRPSSIMPHASGLFRLGAVITPKATEQQRNSAFDFDLSCFSTLHGCRSLCEVMPNVWKEAIQRSLKKEITLPAEELENPACRGR